MPVHKGKGGGRKKTPGLSTRIFYKYKSPKEIFPVAGKHTESLWRHRLFAVFRVDAYTALWRTGKERYFSSVNMKQDLYVEKLMFLAHPVVDPQGEMSYQMRIIHWNVLNMKLYYRNSSTV